MTTLTSRDLSLDIARGLGIVLVVFGHALRGLVSAGFVDDSGWSVPVDYLIYTFHMPLFFVISGLLFSPSVQGQRAPLGAFVTKILVLLAWPYLLWSLLQGGGKSRWRGATR
ncbi:hypothetical protein LPB142_05335 [Rhodobacter xanthinilyticus]|uniref:Acyltransferase 3 domain-containing protein n=1 Tax=Rhodobacter xanthinilyticus TaxID=1850250 RepID=A0A1D9MAB8_9RHOB|nr:acyltransferase family protein [Rhodobacter xanthinilyticus]AOZ68812.1 hypothetical protein LPB142_05335 [Rhodobacter xanthinilyticus]